MKTRAIRIIVLVVPFLAFFLTTYTIGYRLLHNNITIPEPSKPKPAPRVEPKPVEKPKPHEDDDHTGHFEVVTFDMMKNIPSQSEPWLILLFEFFLVYINSNILILYILILFCFCFFNFSYSPYCIHCKV